MTELADRIKEAKERDEARAESEPETPETEEEQEGEESTPEPVPGTEPPWPAEPPAPAQADAGLTGEQASELEKATTAYYRRVSKVFGGELPPECPHCNGLGFDLFGGEGQPEFRTTDQYKVCDDCDGLGKVKTGSEVVGHDLVDCPKCQGRGYLEKLSGPVAVPETPEEYGTPKWMGTVPPGQAV